MIVIVGKLMGVLVGVVVVLNSCSNDSVCKKGREFQVLLK